MGNENSLELLVSIQTQGQDQIDALAGATKNYGDTVSATSGKIKSSLDQIVAALEAEVKSHRNVASAAAQASLAQLDALGPLGQVTAARLRAGEAATKSADDVVKAAQKEADARDAAFRRMASAMDAARKEDAKRTAESAAETTALLQPLTQLGQATGLANYQMMNLARGITGVGSVSGMAVVGLVGLTVAMIAGAKAGYDLVKEYSAAERETSNLANRLGITLMQAEKLTAEAGLTGVSMGSLETAARLLGEALEHPDEQGKKTQKSLNELGIATTDLQGNMSDLGPVILQVLEKLSHIKNDAERAALGQELLGRGSKTLQPLIQNYAELQRVVSQFHVGEDMAGSVELLKADRAIKSLDLSWDQFKKHLAVAIAPIVIPIVTKLTPGAEDDSRELIETAYGGSATDPLTGTANAGVTAARKTLSDRFLKPALDKMQAASLASAQQQGQDALKATGKAATFRASDDKTKEGLAEQLKAAQKQRDELRPILRGGQVDDKTFDKDNAQYNAAVANITRIQKALDGLKETKKEAKEQDSETIALQNQLAGVQAKELTGLEAINARHEALYAHLVAEKKINDENLSLLDQITEAETKRYNQQLALGRVQNGRATGNASYNAQRALDRAHASGDAELALAQGKYTGDDEGAINAAYTSRTSAAGGEYQDAARHIQQMRQESAEREAIQHDQIKLDKETADIEQADIAATGAKALAMYEAQKQKEVELAGLQHKRFTDALTTLNNARTVQDAGTKADIEDQKSKAKLQAELAGATGSTGGPIATLQAQIALKEQAAKRERDEQQQAINTQRQALTELKTQYPAFAADLDKELSRLRAEEVANQRTYERELADDRIEIELKVAEVRRAELEKIRGVTEDIVGAIIDRKGGGAIGDILKAQGVGIAKTLAGNIATTAFTTLLPHGLGLGGIVPGQTKKDANGKDTGELTTLGKLLKGTPFATDGSQAVPQQQLSATKTLTTSNNDLKKSVDQLAAVLKNGQASDGSIQVSGTNADGSIPVAGTNPDGTVAIGSLGSTGSSSAGAITGDITAGGTAVAAVTKALSGGKSSGVGNVLAGLSSVFSGNALPTLMGEGIPGVNGNPGVDPSTGQRIGAGVAIAGTVAAGVMATISQISKGGAQGIIGGVGAAAGTAAALDPDPLSKGILGGVAAAAGLVDALFPNARTTYQNNVNQAMQRDQFVAPTSYNRSTDVSGNLTGYNYKGGIASTPYQDFDVSQGALVRDPFTHGVDTQFTNVPGVGERDNFSIASSVPPPVRAAAPQAQSVTHSITFNVSAMDSKSFLDRSSDIGAAVVKELQLGSGIGSQIQSAVIGN